MNCVIGIACCVEFAPKTLPVVIPSLLAAGIPMKQIHVYGLTMDYGAQELNALRTFGIEHGPEWMFLIHSTCWVEKGFKEAVEACLALAVAGGHDVVGLRPDIMVAHMGLFSRAFAVRSRLVLEQFAEIQTKSERTQFEISGGILAKAARYGHFPSREIWSDKATDRYGTGTPRWTRYFPELHLYKTSVYRSLTEMGDATDTRL